jgi:hypothetical protein
MKKVIPTGKVFGIVFNNVLLLSLVVGLVYSNRDKLPPASHPIVTVFGLAFTVLSTSINIVNSEEEIR